jgi:hypothetical protein
MDDLLRERGCRPDFTLELMKYVLYFTPSGSLARSKSAPGGLVVKYGQYSPHSSAKSTSAPRPLATAPILGQAPSPFSR